MIKPKNQHKKNILICPLNWGLGHATRDIPLIKHFLKLKYNIIIAADKATQALLKQEFPQTKFITIPAVEIKYSKKQNMPLKMLLSSPKILWGIFTEHQLLKKIIKKYDINTVISDNRYGLWNKNIKSIFITHQLEIQVPPKLFLLKKLINKINYLFIKQYDECWIPDYADKHNIAGKLAHPDKKPENIRYIGLLSRFEERNLADLQNNYQILVILSGPEPQRSILQQILQTQVLKSDKKALFVLGKPQKLIKQTKQNIDFINHLAANKLAAYIQNTPYVIARSGYSSIMDFIRLNKSAILIPTPGQTEQEYLARHLSHKNWFYSCNQHNFHLEKALQESKKFSIPKNIFKASLLPKID